MRMWLKTPDVHYVGRIFERTVCGSVCTCEVITRERTAAVARNGKPVWRYLLEVREMRAAT